MSTNLPSVMLGPGEYFVVSGNPGNVPETDFSAGIPASDWLFNSSSLRTPLADSDATKSEITCCSVDGLRFIANGNARRLVSVP